MSAENQKVVNPDETQNVKQTVNRSRRSFAKAGGLAPILMTFSSKAVLGAPYHCTISGMQSGNHSAPHDWTSPCGVGFSPGAWCSNVDKCGKGNPDGDATHWLQAGVIPFTIKLVVVQTSYEYQCLKLGTRYNKQGRKAVKTTTTTGGSTTTRTSYESWSTTQSNLRSCSTSAAPQIISTATHKYIIKNGVDVENSAVYDEIAHFFGSGAVATSFSSIFGGGVGGSMWEVLDGATGSSSGLEWDAIADYLNAKLYESGNAPDFAPVYDTISASDIVNFYKLANGGSTFTSSGGILIDSGFNSAGNPGVSLYDRVKSYLIMIHH
jgi:hypothetical protein